MFFYISKKVISEISEFTSDTFTATDVVDWEFSELPNGLIEDCANGKSIFGGYGNFIQTSTISKEFTKSDTHC